MKNVLQIITVGFFLAAGLMLGGCEVLFEGADNAQKCKQYCEQLEDCAESLSSSDCEADCIENLRDDDEKTECFVDCTDDSCADFLVCYAECELKNLF